MVCIMSQHVYIAHFSHIKHLWHSLVYVCTLSHATPITTDLFLQAITIPNACPCIYCNYFLTIFVGYSSSHCGCYKLNE